MLRIFIFLCRCPELFHLVKMKLHPLNENVPPFFPPVSGNHHSTFRFYEFDYFRYIFGLLRYLSGKESAWQHRRWGFNPWARGSLEKGMAAHSSTLAWRIPWTEEPGGLQSIGLQRVKTWLKDWAQIPHKWDHTVFFFKWLMLYFIISLKSLKFIHVTACVSFHSLQADFTLKIYTTFCSFFYWCLGYFLFLTTVNNAAMNIRV